VQQDFAKARLWYEKAAERDEPQAMSNLAVLYRNGLGVPRNEATAQSWLTRAAERKEALALRPVP
jgi:TPR repeat protein